MIEYDYLCQAILDWREGKRPAAPPPAGGGVVEQYDANTLGGHGDQSGEGYEGYEEIQPYEEAASTTQPQQIPPVGDYAQPPEPQSEFEGEGIDRTQSYVPGLYDPAGANAAGAADYAEAAQQYEESAQQSQEAGAVPVADYEEIEEYESEPVDLDADDDVDVDDALGDDAGDDDDDDFERDYDLEEIDDVASFDLANDLRGYFVAELEIQNAWEDKRQRHALFAKYGVRNEQHYYQVLATLERYVVSDEAEERHGGLDAILQLKMNVSTDVVYQQQQQRIEGELASEFEPVEGVSLQQWAHAQAALASGGDAAEQIAGLGIDQATWDRVSAEWNARMSRDTTATIATEYGKAFSGAGQGQYGAAAADGAQAMTAGGDVEGDAPITLEQWVEITVAQSAGVEQGRDAAEILQSFGMTPADWGAVGAWWGAYFGRHAMEDGQALYHRYNAAQEHYEAQYATADADEDLDY